MVYGILCVWVSVSEDNNNSSSEQHSTMFTIIKYEAQQWYVNWYFKRKQTVN